jgi:hypothetical protein
VFPLEWFYPVFFEVYRNGATPGKRALNLAVVRMTAFPSAVGIDGAQLLRTADLLPFLYGCGLLSMMLNAISSGWATALRAPWSCTATGPGRCLRCSKQRRVIRRCC